MLGNQGINLGRWQYRENLDIPGSILVRAVQPELVEFVWRRAPRV